jgi:hypothetical protein
LVVDIKTDVWSIKESDVNQHSEESIERKFRGCGGGVERTASGTKSDKKWRQGRSKKSGHFDVIYERA